MTFKWIIIECAEHYILLCYKERFLKQHYNAWMWKWIILTFKMNCTAFTRLLISNGFLLSASKQCLIFMTEFKWWLWTHFLREAETYFSFLCTLVALGSLSLNLLLSVCNSTTENFEEFIQMSTHAPWCWFTAAAAEEPETYWELPEVTESELTRFFFLHRSPTVTERLQSEHGRQEIQKTASWKCFLSTMWLLCCSVVICQNERLPEYSRSLKRPQHRWILHCFLTFSFIRQWNKNTKKPWWKKQNKRRITVTFNCTQFDIKNDINLCFSSSFSLSLDNTLKDFLTLVLILKRKIFVRWENPNKIIKSLKFRKNAYRSNGN